MVKQIIFQIEEDLKTESVTKLDDLGITMSGFLRACLEELCKKDRKVRAALSEAYSEIVDHAVKYPKEA